MKTRFVFPLALATAAGILWPGPVCPLAFAAEPRQAALSFDVHKLDEENVEGPNVVRSYFVVGDQWMVFGVPKGCRLTSGDEFVLTPTEPGLDGEIHVRRSPIAPELDLVENTAKYQEAVVAQIPRGAKEVEMQPPVTDFYPFNGWKSLGFVCTYTFYGRPLRRTVGYINLDGGVQVMVTTEASSTSAEKLEKMARSFIGSWWARKPVPGE